MLKAEAEGRDVTTLRRSSRNTVCRIHFAEQSLAIVDERWDAQERQAKYAGEEKGTPVKAAPSTGDLSSDWCVVC